MKTKQPPPAPRLALEPHKCSLDDSTRRMAQEELNEDPKDRENHVEALRSWILSQKHIRSRVGECLSIVILHNTDR